MGADELGHAEGTDAVLAEDLGHLGIGEEELLVLGILEIVLLEVSPQVLHALGAGSRLVAADISELSAEGHGLGESSSFGHFEAVCV